MKTAISIPNNVYETAEALAEQLGTSRSQLYTQAISQYIARHRQNNLTQRLNEVYAHCDTTLDQQLSHMQSHSLSREDW